MSCELCLAGPRLLCRASVLHAETSECWDLWMLCWVVQLWKDIKRKALCTACAKCAGVEPVQSGRAGTVWGLRAGCGAGERCGTAVLGQGSSAGQQCRDRRAVRDSCAGTGGQCGTVVQCRTSVPGALGRAALRAGMPAPGEGAGRAKPRHAVAEEEAVLGSVWARAGARLSSGGSGRWGRAELSWAELVRTEPVAPCRPTPSRWPRAISGSRALTTTCIWAWRARQAAARGTSWTNPSTTTSSAARWVRPGEGRALPAAARPPPRRSPRAPPRSRRRACPFAVPRSGPAGPGAMEPAAAPRPLPGAAAGLCVCKLLCAGAPERDPETEVPAAIPDRPSFTSSSWLGLSPGFGQSVAGKGVAVWYWLTTGFLISLCFPYKYCKISVDRWCLGSVFTSNQSPYISRVWN